MEIKYKITYLEEVIHHHIPSLSSSSKKQIQQAIEKKLVLNPVEFGKPLRYSFKCHRRMRVGDYRIIYRIISETNTVLVIAIKHRKDIYEE